MLLSKLLQTSQDKNATAYVSEGRVMYASLVHYSQGT